LVWWNERGGDQSGWHIRRDPERQLRSVIAGPSRYKVLDIATDGRVLVGHDRDDRVIQALLAGSETPADVWVRDASASTGWPTMASEW
jgi:hypothetical protein